MKKVTVYTDGACSVNPGIGGWAAVLIYKNVKKEISGGELETTNNRMEITAAIKALEALREPCEVELYTDSSWLRNDWKKSDKKPVENKDLWERMLKLTRTHKVTWHHVKGHADNELNNRCDQLARSEIKKLKKQLDAENAPEEPVL